MQEVELAVFDHGDLARETIAGLLARFEAEKHIHVKLQVIPWLDSWSQAVSVALYRDGPDVSEVGSTWVGDFYRMNALRSFSAREVQAIGGKQQFLDACWQEVMTDAFSESLEAAWAIPWTADTRTIFYRRDLLRAAGINEKTAFADADQLEKTLTRLQEFGIEAPLILPTVRSRLTIHNIACWIWGAGGDFVKKDFSEVAFMQPEAFKGIVQYFRLARFLPQARKPIEEAEVNDIFMAGGAAVTIGGDWLIRDQRFPPEMRSEIGQALTPGVPFVGGEHLVVWKHSARSSEALQLIRYLVNSESSLDLFPGFGMPAFYKGLERPPFTNPEYQVMVESLHKGKLLPIAPFWGMVENRLTEVFPFIWDAVLSDRSSDVDTIVRKYLEPAARRLNLTLQG